MNAVPDREREGGFALVEVIAASAIIAGMMTLLFRVVADDARALDAMRERRTALLVARSALDQATGAPDVAAIVRSGTAGRLGWRIDTGGFANGRGGGPSLQRVRVTVFAPAGRTLVALDTLRIVQ